jgi:hypothetical protein
MLLSVSWYEDYLCPFPLYAAFPRAEYYGHSVPIGRSKRKRPVGNPAFHQPDTSEPTVGYPYIPLKKLVAPRSLCGSYVDHV